MTLINIGFVLINLVLVALNLKMLTEYWKDKKK
jgi:hypothetical protein